MASSNIDIIINANDKTRAAFESATKGVSGFGKELDRLKPSFEKVTKAATVGFTGMSALIVTSLNESAGAQADMAIASKTLENALSSLSTESLSEMTEGAKDVAGGLGYMKDVMNDVGSAAVPLGFDDEAASLSFAKLFAASKDTGRALEDQKIAMDLARYSGKSLEEASDALIKVHAGGTRVLKDFGIEAAEGTTAMDAMRMIQERTTGSAKAFADTTAGAMAILKENVNNLRQSIGDALAPAFAKLLEKVQPLIEKFMAWANAHPDLLAKIILVTTAVLGIVSALGFLALVVIPGVIAAFTLLFSPIGMLIAVAAILILKWGAFKQMFIDLWNSITGAVKSAVGAIMGFLQPVFDFITKIINGINQAVDAVKGKLGIGGGGKKKKVNDAVINPQGDIISTHPDDYLIATQNPAGLLGGAGAGNIIINMNGGTYLDDGVAQDIGDKIMRQLQLNMRGA